MNRTLKTLSFLSIFLIAFAVTVPNNVHASSDPSRWKAKPTDHYNSIGANVANPANAYDNDNNTAADITIGTAGRFEVIDFTRGAQNSSDIIAYVDICMKYDFSGGKCDYAIWLYVSPSYSPVPSNVTLVSMGQTANSGTMVWKDVTEPNDLTWSWSDISDLRVVVEFDNCGGGRTTMLNEYEVWANVYYYNSPTLYVDPSSVSKGVGQSFSVDINITGFTAGNWSGGVYGWEFKLGYDGTKLNASTIACNGTGKYLNTGWYYRINWSDTLGLIWYTCTLMGDVPGKTGDGILATVTFNVKAAGSCTLDLHGTKLSGYDYLNKRVYSISHTAVDGSWLSGAVPEFPYGAALEMALAGVIVYVWWRRRRKKPTSISHLPPSALSKA